MNELVFHTGGSWDTTTLHQNGYEVAAAQLYIELRAGRDDYGDPVHGGVFEGADLMAIIRPAEDPENPYDLFPGRLTLEFPGYTVILENRHPEVNLTHLNVWLNGDEITHRVIDLVIDINAIDDVVSAFVSVYKSRFLLRDEVITHTII
jgi:hypothetical protein